MVPFREIEHPYVGTTKYSQIDVKSSLACEDVRRIVGFFITQKKKRSGHMLLHGFRLEIQTNEQEYIMSWIDLDSTFSVLPVDPLTLPTLVNHQHPTVPPPEKHSHANLNAWTPSSHSQHPALW